MNDQQIEQQPVPIEQLVPVNKLLTYISSEDLVRTMILSGQKFIIKNNNSYNTFLDNPEDIIKRLKESIETCDIFYINKTAFHQNFHQNLEKKIDEALIIQDTAEKNEVLLSVLTSTLVDFYVMTNSTDISKTNILAVKNVVSKMLSQDRSNLLLLFKENQKYSTINHSINTMVLIMNYIQKNPKDFAKIDPTQIAIGAILHDIGKVYMPELVNFPGKFSPEQREKMEQHPKLGYEMAIKAGIKDPVILGAIYNHHQRINGQGYPVQKEDLEPTNLDYLFGLIDSFEAMTSDRRPYKEAIPVYNTLQILKKDIENKNMYSAEQFKKFVKSLGKDYFDSLSKPNPDIQK